MVVNYLLAIIIDEHVKKRNSVIKHKELTKIMNDDKTTCNKMLNAHTVTPVIQTLTQWNNFKIHNYNDEH